MMNTGNHRGTYALMSLSTIGLMLFFAFWLRQSYKQEKEQLRRDANYLLMSTVRQVEDSLMQAHPWRINNVVEKMALTTSDTLKLGVRIMYSTDTFEKPDLSQMHSRRLKMKQQDKHRMPGMIGHFVLDDFTPETELPYCVAERIESLLINRFASLKVELDLLPSAMIVINGDSSIGKHEIVSSRIYQDLMTEATAQVVVGSYSGGLLFKLIPKILISLAILIITLFSFYQLHKNAAQQRQLAQAREALIANITHELNTPITSAGLALEAIQSRNMNEQDKEEYVMLASGEIKRLSSLVEKIMIGIGNTNTHKSLFQQLNVNELVDDVLVSMKLKIEQMHGTIHVVARDKNIIASADRLEITGVIQNLIDNALKYSQPKPEIEIQLSQTDEQVKFSISDNGVGIPKDLRSQVFEPFYRVPTGDRHDVKGHGLGLNFVKKVIDGHDGKIAVLENKQGGTTVEFILQK